MFIITYTSYNQYRDREVYACEAVAMRRFEQLAACRFVTKLEIVRAS